MANPTGRRTAPYKDFLSPALHRRFASTTALLIVVAYLEALVLANWSSWFWAWFPFGPAFLRTLFLFVGGLVVLVLRLEYYHFGVRTSTSVFRTFVQSLTRAQTYWAILWYAVSSAVICLPMIASFSADPEMHWVVYRNGDRARLNEKPLFLTTYLLSCAVVQAVEHVVADMDRLVLGNLIAAKASSSAEGQKTATSPFGHVIGRVPSILTESLLRAALALIGHLFAYYLLWRSFAWGWTMLLLRPFYNLPRTNMLPPSGPATFVSIKASVMSGFLLFFLWRVSNVAFSTFMARKPLKDGKPLSAESKDPNGSLLDGLKSKKQNTRAYAMWELAFIARDFEDRRKSIFEDIDRKDGPVWSQIYAICLDLVKSLTVKVDEYGKQPAPPPPEPPAKEPKARSTAPPKDDAIFRRQPATRSMRQEVDKVLDSVARSPGETPMSSLSPAAKKTWKMAKDRVLTPEQQDALLPQTLLGKFKQLLVRVLRYDWVGPPFRQQFRKRLAVAVLGTPSAELGLYMNAIEVLGTMTVKSLGEDKFGNVHRDVPAIIRTFTVAVQKLAAFKAEFPIHWTDVEGRREAPEVDALLGALAGALGKLVYEFEPYRNDLRLTLTDIRLAKEAAQMEADESRKGKGKGKGPDMAEIRR